MGVEWVIAGSATIWSQTELDILVDFEANGGNVWVVGEYPSIHSDINQSGNSVLVALKSGLSFDLNASNNSGDATNISPHPFTVGVTNWDGGSAGSILGGQALVTHDSGAVLVAVSQVPVPAAVWLFGSALAGLGWMRRKRTV